MWYIFIYSVLRQFLHLLSEYSGADEWLRLWSFCLPVCWTQIPPRTNGLWSGRYALLQEEDGVWDNQFNIAWMREAVIMKGHFSQLACVPHNQMPHRSVNRHYCRLTPLSQLSILWYQLPPIWGWYVNITSANQRIMKSKYEKYYRENNHEILN